jgi:DNA polymerase-3 subunit alpha (Gram-positive type)
MVESYVSFDLETTGLNPKRDKIIEVGAIKIIDGIEVDNRSFFVNPGIKLSPMIIKLTGIVDEDLVAANTINDEVEELIEFIGELPLLGQNILFDYSFLKKACLDNKIEFEKVGLDTLRLARIYLPQLSSKKLGALCEYYQIPLIAHRASEDARATHILYQKLCGEFYDVRTFAPQKLFCKMKRDTLITNRQVQFLTDLINRYNLEVEYTVSKLFKSEASREIDRILSTYGR